MGLIDGKKLGTVYSNYCFKEKRYCAAANCSTIDGLQKLTVWHCSETNDCNEIETLLKKELGITFICKCLFGAKDVDLSNEQLMLSHLFPPMITKTDGGDVGGGNGTPPVTPTEAATTVYTTDGSPSLTPNASTEGENHSFRPTVANLWLIFVLLTLGLLVS
uniref:Uncharacterized protein n=1 Tax=Globodera pallida TaxID=36090 RepID=A0A183C3G6_GLOPA